MANLLEKREQLIKELEATVINIDDVNAKVEEFRNNLLKQLEHDNSKKIETIKTKIAFIDELINEDAAKLEVEEYGRVNDVAPSEEIVPESNEETALEVSTDTEKSFY